MEILFTLTGEINANVVAEAINWITNQLYLNKSATPDQKITKLKFHISSIGGDIDSAIRLYDYLTALPVEVETVGFGQVDSAAVTIFAAGKQRLALEKCRFLIHEGTFTIGNPVASLHNHEETLLFLQQLLKRNIEIIATTTKKSAGDIEAVLRKGDILSAEKAKAFGLVTDIIKKLSF